MRRGEAEKSCDLLETWGSIIEGDDCGDEEAGRRRAVIGVGGGPAGVCIC